VCNTLDDSWFGRERSSHTVSRGRLWVFLAVVAGGFDKFVDVVRVEVLGTLLGRRFVGSIDHLTRFSVEVEAGLKVR
jgi:hypothetical protein